MSISSSQSGSTVIISISDRFDFSCHKEFREVYTATDGISSNYVVDLSKTDYIDSSALGMLLLLREYSRSSNGDVTLRGASADVKEILLVSNFDKLFTLN